MKSLIFHQHLQTHINSPDPFHRIDSDLCGHDRMYQFEFSYVIAIDVRSYFLTRVPANEWRVLLVSKLDQVV